MKLNGQVALLIGTTPLAIALARALSRKQCRLVITDRDMERAQALAMATHGLALALDHNDPAMWDNVIAASASLSGPISLAFFADDALPAHEGSAESAHDQKLISTLYKLDPAQHPLLGVDKLHKSSGQAGRCRTVHFFDSNAWRASPGAPMRSALQHGLRAWLEAGQRAQGVAHRPSLIVGCGVPPSKPAPDPNEIASATLWALERDQTHAFVPGGWGVKAFLRQR